MRTKSIAESNPVFDVTSNPLRTGNDAPCEILRVQLYLGQFFDGQFFGGKSTPCVYNF